MYTAEKYVFAETAEAAAQLLRASPNARIIAGGTWLKMTKVRISSAIDLSRAGLDKIERMEGAIRIGAMASLREIETHPILREAFDGVLPQSVSPIVGVQFRNCATIGAGVSSAFGFSDPLCALLALDADVELALGGRMKLSRYLEIPRTRKNRDVLKYIWIPDEPARASWQSFRQTATDFSVLNLCLVQKTDGNVRLCIGARPMKARRCPETERLIQSGDIEGAIRSLDSVAFGTNLRGSADYRRTIARVLLEDAMDALREVEK